MDERTKRATLRRYFTSLYPVWAILGIVSSLVFALLAILPLSYGYPNVALTVVSLSAIGLLVVLFFGASAQKAAQAAADARLDAWLEEDLQKLSKTSLTKLATEGSDLVSDPVQITGPRLWDTGGATVLFRKGQDNRLRFTPVSVSIIHFTQNQLLAYECVFDSTTGRPLNERTEEYFYKDVVAVSTKSESRTVKSAALGTLQLTAAETFTLTTAGGTSLSVVLSDPSLIAKMGGGEIPTSRAEKAVLAVRKMLRDKKTN